MNLTKRAMAGAFWLLLEEKPLGRITVKDVVERCQMNRNTFYYHFQDLRALTEYALEEWLGALARERCVSGPPLERFARLVQGVAERRAAVMNLCRSSGREPFLNGLERLAGCAARLCAGVPAGLPEGDRRTLLRFYKCVFAGVALDWLDGGMDYDAGAFVRRAAVLLQKTPAPHGPPRKDGEAP